MERFPSRWLALREGADAAARAAELLDPLRRHLSGRGGSTLSVADLGCGTGAMGRWLAPRLDGRQHWLLCDHDPALLAEAATRMPERSGDARPVAATTRRGDVAGLTAAELTGVSLVTTSALLDLLTRRSLDALAAACTGAGAAALLTLSVRGRVELEPADPLDAAVEAAFNAHQRRGAHDRLLGPDAVDAARRAFQTRGATVRTRPSPWRLGAGDAELTAEWLRGRAAAAGEWDPSLPAGAYLRRRLRQCAAGELSVIVHHDDLLALPR